MIVSISGWNRLSIVMAADACASRHPEPVLGHHRRVHRLDESPPADHPGTFAHRTPAQRYWCYFRWSSVDQQASPCRSWLSTAYWSASPPYLGTKFFGRKPSGVTQAGPVGAGLQDVPGSAFNGRNSGSAPALDLVQPRTQLPTCASPATPLDRGTDRSSPTPASPWCALQIAGQTLARHELTLEHLTTFERANPGRRNAAPHPTLPRPPTQQPRPASEAVIGAVHSDVLPSADDPRLAPMAMLPRSSTPAPTMPPSSIFFWCSRPRFASSPWAGAYRRPDPSPHQTWRRRNQVGPHAAFVPTPELTSPVASGKYFLPISACVPLLCLAVGLRSRSRTSPAPTTAMRSHRRRDRHRQASPICSACTCPIWADGCCAFFFFGWLRPDRGDRGQRRRRLGRHGAVFAARALPLLLGNGVGQRWLRRFGAETSGSHLVRDDAVT